MRITIVDTTITTAPTGGAQTFLVGLCHGLRQKGWSISVVTENGSHRSVIENLDGLGVTILEDLWKRTHLPEERAQRLADWVNRTGTDAYVISISPDAGWLALPLLNPVIARFSVAHADVDAFYAPLRHYGMFIDCAVGVSCEIRRKIAELHVPETQQIPYGVPSLTADAMQARLGTTASDGPLRIGYIGRIEQAQKRILDLVPLALILKEREVEVEIHLVGDGSVRERLVDELHRARVSNLVRFWGWSSREEVLARFSELDVLLLFSDSEGLPVALLEGVGQALVPVVTRIDSGNAEIVRDGVNGFLLPVGDMGGFADRLESLAKDRARLRKMSRAAWETSKEYTVERMVERYATSIESHCEQYSNRNQTGQSTSYPLMPSCRSPYPRWLRKIKWRLTALTATG